MNRLQKYYIIFVLLAFSPDAYAYIDPGSTLFLIQGLLALMGGLLVFIKKPIQTIKNLIAKIQKRKDA
jgi:hypothetical protein